MFSNKNLTGIVLLLILFLSITPIYAETGFLHATYEYHFIQEKTEKTTGVYVRELIDKSEIEFFYDYIVVDIAGYLQVSEVKNLGENLDFWLVYITGENETNYYGIALAYFNFFQKDNYIIDIRNILLDSVNFGDYKNVSKTYNNNLTIGDIVITEEVQGTVTYSYFLHFFVDFYKKDFEVRQDFLEEITDMDSILDIFFAPLSIPLVLMSSTDELERIIGIIFLAGELIIAIIIAKHLYYFISGW